MSQPYAKIVADSISPDGQRLTSVEMRFHRFILAEVNTHRVLSRNSASSRAIPVAKQLDRVRTDTAFPVAWPAEQKGMQGGEHLDDAMTDQARGLWEEARDFAITSAENLMALGLHKSVTNRLLEPFAWHTALVTATAWDNFFHQRVSPLAQPEFKAVAEMFLDAYSKSDPEPIEEGRYHLPYVQHVDWPQASKMAHGIMHRHPDGSCFACNRVLVQVASARCARTSYMTQDGKRDLQEDLNLYRRLCEADPMHASPLEHVATPDGDNEHVVRVVSKMTGKSMNLVLPKYGNFLGWQQHRIQVEIERSYQSYA